MRRIMCWILLFMGFVFWVWGLAVVGLGQIILLALLVVLLVPITLYLLRWLSGCFSWLLPLVIVLGGMLAVIWYLANQPVGPVQPPTLFIVGIICFVGYGLCISSPHHLAGPTE